MKKALSTIIILALCMSIFASIANASTKQNSWDRVKKAGTIVVGIDNSYPPMEFTDKAGKTIGFDIDMANAIGKKLGVKVKFVPTAWDGIFLALQSKKFDIVHSSVSITDKRKETMIFSDPYVYGGNAIFVKASNTSIKSQNDFKDKIIGVQIGTTGQEVVSKLSGLKEIKKYNAMTEAFMDLGNGRVEAVVADPFVGDYYITAQKSTFKRITSLLNSEPIGVAFRKEDSDLRNAYQKAIDSLKKDGTLSKISNKWFGKDIYKK